MCIILILLTLILMVFLGSYYYVEWCGRGNTYTFTKNVPENRVGLVLGTNPVSSLSKRSNPYYYFRIDAAVRLYKAGKIKRILVSGDNKYKSYNEPDMMKADLVKAGIPAMHIYCDYAGFRTLDSVVRAKKVFGLSTFTVISQEFHNNRALALARWQGINAVGYNAKDVNRKRGLYVQAREVLARTKMILDMLINKQPHFLGEMIEIK